MRFSNANVQLPALKEPKSYDKAYVFITESAMYLDLDLDGLSVRLFESILLHLRSGLDNVIFENISNLLEIQHVNKHLRLEPMR